MNNTILDPDDYELVMFTGSGLIEFQGPSRLDGSKLVALTFVKTDESSRMIAFPPEQLPELIANLKIASKTLVSESGE